MFNSINIPSQVLMSPVESRWVQMTPVKWPSFNLLDSLLKRLLIRPYLLYLNSSEKKKLVCTFDWHYIHFILQFLTCLLWVLVVSQNKHWFDDILWTSLIEKYMCGFWCWLAQNESNEDQNFTSVWRKRPLICWFPLNEPRWQIYVWLLVLTCSKRVQRGPKFH